MALQCLALGLTSTTGHTAETRRDENTRFGIAVDNTALEPPMPGSIEAVSANAGLGLSIADLHRARTEARGSADSAPVPDRIRMRSAYLHTPVLDAFGGIHSTPVSTVAEDPENM
ncbi:hypothetical protein F4561_003730 [Lipingzhangella halophila]|uniref:Uncharacterized protein n=1 Tax=Lipingzhangella halophila TaxID=1783352 RepID=A0A7W7W4N2_9ACTN|nr:hypothetical protein [Lipingzhangella halophila]MBB4932910.1 hypothetical protein [Lipingzhangella halophila]